MSSTFEIMQTISDTTQKMMALEKERDRCAALIAKLSTSLKKAKCMSDKGKEFEPYVLQDVNYTALTSEHVKSLEGDAYKFKSGRLEITAQYIPGKFTVMYCVTGKFKVIINYTKSVEYILSEFGRLTDFYISTISSLTDKWDLYLSAKVTRLPREVLLALKGLSRITKLGLTKLFYYQKKFLTYAGIFYYFFSFVVIFKCFLFVRVY